jgi:CheY-like chemotaxis protein
MESALGEGSTFWFTASFDRSAVLAPASPAVSPSLQGMRVLIVDDHPINCDIYTEQLAAWALRPDAACSGSQALARLREAAARGDPYRLALLDMLMPEMDGITLAEQIKADPHIASVILVMLTPLGAYGDEQRAQQAGILQYLHKPVRQSRLYDCLINWVRASGEWRLPSFALDAPRPAGAAALSGHILLAEDNPVNQEVAMAMLEALDCHVTLATNGREAFDLSTQHGYDLVLMDWHMPEMDGLSATAAIRAWEVEHAQPRRPIIALTANAIEGDRERCLAAGMDDYLSKPFTLEQLQAVLSEWLPSCATTPVPPENL